MTGYRWCQAAMVAAAVGVACGFSPRALLFAQERPAEASGLQMVAAMEDALVQAIARAEKSVVSIARVAEKSSVENEYKPDAFGNQRSQPPKPGTKACFSSRRTSNPGPKASSNGTLRISDRLPVALMTRRARSMILIS